MTEPVPKTHDWVKTRAECSVDYLFMLLTEVMDSDVKNMQARSPDAQVALVKLTDAKVLVSKRNVNGFGDGGKVMIERTPLGISVKNSQDVEMFIAKPTVGPAGTCRLEVDSQPLELWQVSRRALEDLFFS